MLDILTRASCFAAIILLGHILRRTGVFGPEAFGVISKIVMKITLPAAIIAGSAGKPIDASMLTLALLGLVGGLIYAAVGWLVSRRNSRAEQAFCIQNIVGFNVGTFAMPFTQSFLGPVGVQTSSIFDLGNALMCFGGSFCISKTVQEGGKADFSRILKTAGTSIPFLAHLMMTALNLTGLTLPKPVLNMAEILGGGNTCLAMLMVGVGIQISLDRSKIGTMVKILGTRFGMAIILALCCYYLLPFGLEIRQTLVILMFTPFTSTTPFFTGELKGDTGLASTMNSVSILISIVLIVTLLTVML